nr:PREDICTED: uncharacterized protein LOC107398944 [Tribolium castaneum]|eukprot:XP_015840014.1 PREDICTED: uncharacterized protein LOC107398944 [Tribolium castaneum]
MKDHGNFRLCADHFADNMFTHPQKKALRGDAIPHQKESEQSSCVLPGTSREEVAATPPPQEEAGPSTSVHEQQFASPTGKSVATQTGTALSSNSPRKQALRRKLRQASQTTEPVGAETTYGVCL